MHRRTYSVISIGAGFLLLMALVMVHGNKSPFFQAEPPDIERIVTMHPEGWAEVAGYSNDDEWNESYQGVYDNAVYKHYRNAKGDIVMVVITWSRDGINHPGHLQQVCYRSGGSTVSPPEHSSFQTRMGMHKYIGFVAHHDNRVDDIMYWRVTGGKPYFGNDPSMLLFTSYSFKDRMADRFGKMIPLAKSFVFGLPDNVMVRVSTERAVPNEPATAHIEYAKAFLESLPDKDRKIVMGGE